jgi:hypothetical protein
MGWTNEVPREVGMYRIRTLRDGKRVYGVCALYRLPDGWWTCEIMFPGRPPTLWEAKSADVHTEFGSRIEFDDGNGE